MGECWGLSAQIEGGRVRRWIRCRENLLLLQFSSSEQAPRELPAVHTPSFPPPLHLLKKRKCRVEGICRNSLHRVTGVEGEVGAGGKKKKWKWL